MSLCNFSALCMAVSVVCPELYSRDFLAKCQPLTVSPQQFRDVNKMEPYSCYAILLQATRKVAKCGYLFVAPGWDFSNPLNRTKVSTLLFQIACTCRSLRRGRHCGLAVYRKNSL
jgi:hypothetical protein